eukprot:CAMPEP_0174347490 /NCGR_PEP_ID=MMETSP0811_2-20130205/3582_1 /TAXON_ID=73025 ORGANISM="Eutreptiella gymnastica-like, Strain CCMP1594" /NCGR_SAMPLE_ID=MMETSP0811_2 /ASSEMBLY_ACC=CAM_ASM_000667 /LENGTH=211 /DNA_ID=CAMNT_0015473115 /DNA_START=112 /DNA_END=742 /DNA_ORIENTATION=+
MSNANRPFCGKQVRSGSSEFRPPPNTHRGDTGGRVQRCPGLGIGRGVPCAPPLNPGDVGMACTTCMRTPWRPPRPAPKAAINVTVTPLHWIAGTTVRVDAAGREDLTRRLRPPCAVLPLDKYHDHCQPAPSDRAHHSTTAQRTHYPARPTQNTALELPQRRTHAAVPRRQLSRGPKRSQPRNQTCHWRPAGKLVLSSDRPRIKGHSVIPAP